MTSAVKVSKSFRERELEKVLLFSFKKFDKIARLCEEGIDGDQEYALNQIYKNIPSMTKYTKLLR